MSSARRQNTTPIIVEVRPSNTTKGPSTLAPATPPSPSSPKAVRFASAEPVSGVSRPLNPTEAWSLWHFETHARQCHDCNDPYSVYLNGDRLCPTGHALAQDVACHVCHREGEVYSTKKDNHKYVRVEIPHGYDQVRGLLRSLDRRVRRAERIVPIISYDRNYPVSARRREPETEPEPQSRAEVIVEPARTPRRHDSKRYSYDLTADEDSQASRARRRETEERAKRGSLYEKDMQRPRKEYRVEVREPADADRRRRKEREVLRESERKRESERDRGERRRRKDEKR